MLRQSSRHWSIKKTALIVKCHCSSENYVHMCELFKVPPIGTLIDFPRTRERQIYYQCRGERYKLSFSSPQPKAKDSRKHLCNVIFLHIQQTLTDKMVPDLRRQCQ